MTFNPASSAMAARLRRSRMPSCSHSVLAFAATAWRATSGVYSGLLEYVDMSIGTGTSASDGYAFSPRIVSAFGLTGMIL